ncbi:MAG: hypothetical protein ABI574_17545 [Burkholderiales bacterium]
MRPADASLRNILASAVLAPSADNRHTLRFRVLADQVQLLSTDQPTWKDLPHRRYLALLSYGAAIENAALASGRFGLVLEVVLMPDPLRPEVIANLQWTTTTALPDPLADAIESRHTNRRFYQRAPAPPQQLAALTQAVAGVPDAGLLWLNQPPARSRALRLIRVAETERFRQPALHAELFGAMRFDNGWRDGCDEGLPLGALEVEPPLRGPFAQLRRWPVMRALHRLGAHQMLGVRAGYLPCALAPHLGLLMMRGLPDTLCNLQAGRAFQRLWLAATGFGLALQPMAAATTLVRQRPGDGWVSAAVHAQLLQGLAALAPAGEDEARMLFRMGRAPAPSVVAKRPPLDQLLV